MCWLNVRYSPWFIANKKYCSSNTARKVRKEERANDEQPDALNEEHDDDNNGGGDDDADGPPNEADYIEEEDFAHLTSVVGQINLFYSKFVPLFVCQSAAHRPEARSLHQVPSKLLGS